MVRKGEGYGGGGGGGGAAGSMYIYVAWIPDTVVCVHSPLWLSTYKMCQRQIDALAVWCFDHRSVYLPLSPSARHQA